MYKYIKLDWLSKVIDKNKVLTLMKPSLVAKGYRKKQGLDFDETFPSVAMLKSIKILLAIVAYYDYKI